MVETSYIELCFVLPVFLQNLHNCFFLSRLLIPYYTTVFRDQIKACIAGTSHVIKQHTKPTGQRHSIFYFTYALLFRYSESTCFLYFCLEMSKQSNLFHGHGFRVTLVRHGIIIIAYQLRTTCQVRKNSRELAGFASSAVKLHCYSL